MPHTLAAGEVLELRIFCQLTDQVSQTVRHWYVTAVTAPSVTDLDWAQEFDSELAPKFKAVMPAVANYLGVTVQVIKPTRFVHVVRNTNAGAGGLPGEALPPMVAGRLRFTTNLAGKRFRGRVYLPFPGEGSNDATGNPTAGYKINAGDISDYFALSRSLTLAGGSATLDPVIYSRVGNTTTIIRNGFVESVWGSNRHRSRQKHGDVLPF